MVKPINELVDKLPESNITTFALNALDILVPGEWENWVGWERTIAAVTRQSDPKVIQTISTLALKLYNDDNLGYKSAVNLYQTIDNADVVLGTAALADKVGGKIPLFGGLIKKLTPKADTTQTLDLALKTAVEVMAYKKLEGNDLDIKGSVARLTAEYTGPSLIRMAGLLCFDGLIPLGPDFIDKVMDHLDSTKASDLEKNGTFKVVNHFFPGGDTGSKFNFIQQSFGELQGWMAQFVQDRDLTPARITSSLQNFIELSDDKLDYLAAFLDMSTNYFEHTGIQTVAREVIEDAYRRFYGNAGV